MDHSPSIRIQKNSPHLFAARRIFVPIAVILALMFVVLIYMRSTSIKVARADFTNNGTPSIPIEPTPAPVRITSNFQENATSVVESNRYVNLVAPATYQVPQSIPNRQYRLPMGEQVNSPTPPDLQKLPGFQQHFPELPAPLQFTVQPPLAEPVAQPETMQLAPGQLEIAVNERQGTVSSTMLQGMVTLSVRDTPLLSVMSLIAQQQGLSIVVSSELNMPITLTLQPTTLPDALDALMAVSGCNWTQKNNIIYVTAVKKDGLENFFAQGRTVRTFNLSYIAATDAEKVITGLLSPAGKVFSRQTDPKDKRKTLEQLVVEDVASYVDRIGDYLAEADRPPQQVIVEVRLLQVKLENDVRHGLNFDTIARISGADLKAGTQSLATAVGAGATFTIDGTDFNSFLDCLASTNDAKTLAAPKVLMINGQEAKIQIGRRLGYNVTTTTETSSLQDVRFLEVGVVLTVTPQISFDGQILLKVHPKVSSGDINPNTNLPEEETTEVDTAIMVADGNGVIIGGLIQESDNERQSKIPILGDVWLVGRLFQRRVVERERSEVVVALLPRIVPIGYCPSPSDVYDLQRVVDPIVTPALQSAPRMEPKLPDSLHRPTRLSRKSKQSM